MNAKKLCCLVTITAMLFFGLPAIPFANVDRVPQLSQEELGLVFQNPDSTWNGKPEFLKYLDEKEMKETEGKIGPWVATVFYGALTGAIAGGLTALHNGGSVSRAAFSGALGGAVASGSVLGVGRLLASFPRFSSLSRAADSVASGVGGAAGGIAGAYACGGVCHSIRLYGEH